MQTMSALDSLFLHVENDVSHMHLGAVALFEGPAPGVMNTTTPASVAPPRISRVDVRSASRRRDPRWRRRR